MKSKKFLKQAFKSNGMPVKKGDVKYIGMLFTNVAKEQMTLKEFPEVKNEVPMTIVDKGELWYD
ncbi:hypothetical protein [Planococcus sp. CAU13]|uniref:hypothetical protein n=1 Tax=Planococcus sp. CAU13 TaxID=1541197 RepID=UPI000530089F|nr:hypothetical protein [Planococcus sp. CAU13]